MELLKSGESNNISAEDAAHSKNATRIRILRSDTLPQGDAARSFLLPWGAVPPCPKSQLAAHVHGPRLQPGKRGRRARAPGAGWLGPGPECAGKRGHAAHGGGHSARGALLRRCCCPFTSHCRVMVLGRLTTDGAERRAHRRASIGIVVDRAFEEVQVLETRFRSHEAVQTQDQRDSPPHLPTPPPHSVPPLTSALPVFSFYPSSVK
jgi:hypothetical protein